MTILLVFALSFIQNYLATREIYAISKADPIVAAMWAGLCSSFGFAIIIIIVVQMDRWVLIGPYVLGDVAATYLALKNRK